MLIVEESVAIVSVRLRGLLGCYVDKCDKSLCGYSENQVLKSKYPDSSQQIRKKRMYYR